MSRIRVIAKRILIAWFAIFVGIPAFYTENPQAQNIVFAVVGTWAVLRFIAWRKQGDKMMDDLIDERPLDAW